MASAPFAMPVAGLAQSRDKVIRLGILVSGTLEQRAGLDQALIEGLRSLGYIEGKNLLLERRYGHGMSAMMDEGMAGHAMSHDLSRSARELAEMKVDAIVTSCAPSTHAAKAATSSIPIVMAAVSDPVSQGLIASLAKPGRNVTGLSSQADELLPKRLELVAAILPPKTPIAVLANSRNPVHAPMWQMLKDMGDKPNLRLSLVQADDEAGLPAALEAVAAARAKALFVLPDDPMVFNMRARIVAFAANRRLPDFYWTSEFVEAGGLLSYGASLRESYAAAASYIDKVVKGAKPAALPVAQPTRFELVVNQKTAKRLGLAIPPSILQRADRVIE